MMLDPYQSFIHLSRYSRWLPEKSRRETWDETVNRYVDFVLKRSELDEVRDELRQAIHDLKVMPSMRSLMTAGPAAERDNIAMFNCSFCVIDSPRAFDEILYILMCGTGCGFSVENQHVSKLPVVAESFHDTDSTIVVGDSKVGWASAFRELVSLLYVGKVPKWDVSKVRPEGAPLKVFGGRSSGPEPLVGLFEFAIKLFRKAAGRQLTSLEAHDLVCQVASVVVVGGVRRAALISLSDLGDLNMAKAKSGSWWDLNPQRSIANNSAIYTGKPAIGLFMSEWQSLYESRSGERGIINRNVGTKFSPRRTNYPGFGTNPCCSYDTLLLTSEGDLPIGSLVGKSVDVWNGEKWCQVTPFSTGINPVVDVLLSNGTIIRCTPYHNFVIINDEGNKEFVQADDLDYGDEMAYYEVINTDGTNSGKSVRFVSATWVEEDEETFCVTEPELHQATFNRIVTGNCSEIVLRPNQFCNLSEVIIRSTDSKEEILNKVRQATILGTIQSSFTDFKYLRSIWKKNSDEERLLGVSFTGICDNKFMSTPSGELEDFLILCRETAINTNKVWAERIGINPSVAITCVKPAGTVSELVGSSSGIHPAYSNHYLRTVRNSTTDPISTVLVDSGVPYETDVMNSKSYVFSFPRKANAAKTKADVSALDQLELALLYRRNWTEHNVSVTVYVGENEWLDVAAYVYKNFDDIFGVSFLPKEESDHTYQQAPFQEITEAEYEDRIASFPSVIDWSVLRETQDETVSAQQLACSSGVCSII
jgi:ribonucleotide reductase alpha subunit